MLCYVKIIAVSEIYNLPVKPRVYISSSSARKNYISLHNEGGFSFYFFFGVKNFPLIRISAGFIVIVSNL